jgi:hypothetical protein
MVAALRSKWAPGKVVRAGLAVGGRISEPICNRRATPPPAHFQRNPPGRGRLAVFPRCSLLTYQSRYARRSRLEKQPTDPASAGRRHHYMRDGTLEGGIFRILISERTSRPSGPAWMPCPHTWNENVGPAILRIFQ